MLRRVSVGGIVLAAGRGARMGRPKQLLPLDGRPLLQHVLDAAASARRSTTSWWCSATRPTEVAAGAPPAARGAVWS